MDRMKVNTFHESEIDDGKTFMLGSEGAAASVSVVDFDTNTDTLYGFYAPRAIEITGVEHIVIEEHACVTTAGIVSITDGTTVYATVTAVDEKAAHGHITGVVSTTPKVSKGTMIYAKTTTQSVNSTSGTAGEGYFFVFYK